MYSKLAFPTNLFVKEPHSYALYSKSNQLLTAQIAADGQWRFNTSNKVPPKFSTCILQYEDVWFYYHIGINPISICKAILTNVKKQTVKRGASTITMQLSRLYFKNRKRTYIQKIKESITAFVFEFKFSKKEILKYYSNYAPFGSNVVGIDAASWRYFHTAPENLSWAESATLAVLPNNPALIHISKNRNMLIKKRNFLLLKMYHNKKISQIDYQLAVNEPLADKPYPLPQDATHLLAYLKTKEKSIHVFNCTINQEWQIKAQEIVNKNLALLKLNHINNVAAIIIDNNTNEVVTYIGNSKIENNKKATVNYDNHQYVDCTQAWRSSGSILKPFLYCNMLHDGEILPTQLVDDIPTEYDGYSPKNFNLSYDGMVPVNRALARSLNVPAVRMLHNYGVVKFYHHLKKMGLSTITRPYSDYGLSLILGGAEVKLTEICNVYSNMCRKLKNKNASALLYYNLQKKENSQTLNADKASIYLTMEAMKEVARSEENIGWKKFSSTRQIAWKTGTSFGYRDAWAVGCNKNFTIGVWVGNASGEGRAGLTGIACAAPILFELVTLLPNADWFDFPKKEIKKMKVCKASGYIPSDVCDDFMEINAPIKNVVYKPCPFHEKIYTDKTGVKRVHNGCESIDNMMAQNYFVLPPVQEFYYKSSHTNYKPLPPYRADCNAILKSNIIDFIYPKDNTKLLLPKELNGNYGKIILKAAHKNSNAIIYWQLDDNFIGTTTKIHQMAIQPSNGNHTINITDNLGNSVTKKITIIKN